ncbi:hypothetical protein LCGC14_3113760, partial [marine sediment metagenome]
KEVVEWIEQDKYKINVNSVDVIEFSEKAWKAKKAKWGIKEEV